MNAAIMGFFPENPIVSHRGEFNMEPGLMPVLSGTPICQMGPSILRAGITELRGDWKFFKDSW